MREELKSLACSEARRIQPVYARSGWRWCVRDGKTVEPYVPDVQDVEDHILRAMEELDSEDVDRSISSGRLSCWRERSLGYLSFGVALNMESVDFEETAEDDEHWAFDPDYTVAPGRTLESWREEQGLSYREAAARCAMPAGEFADLLDGRLPITEERAAKIAEATGSTARFWLTRERHYRTGQHEGKFETPSAARFALVRATLKESFGGGMVQFDTAYHEALGAGRTPAEAQTIGVDAYLDAFETMLRSPEVPESAAGGYFEISSPDGGVA